MPNTFILSQPGLTRLPVQKIVNGLPTRTEDSIAVEEPLEISLEYGPATNRRIQPISVTMRTPGQDTDLAIGFLFTEGILPENSTANTLQTDPNKITIQLPETILPDITKLQRNFYTTSSCGVCGKSSIDAIKTNIPKDQNIEKTTPIDPQTLLGLPEIIREAQNLFDSTGGIHAAGLFNTKGQLIAIREDIGRHNAVDKLIGHALQTNLLPLNDHILLLSGRACFELIQKAAMAGIPTIAAIGPPSSLAIQLAEENNITLIGFLRQQRFNIYSAAHRIKL